MRQIIIIIFITSFFSTMLYADQIYTNPLSSITTMNDWKGNIVVDDGVLLVKSENLTSGMKGISKDFQPNQLAGKVIRVECEVMGIGIRDDNRKSPYHGAKIQFTFTAKNKKSWLDLMIPSGDFPWRKVNAVTVVPQDLDSALLNIGFQDSAGTMKVRNLHIERLGESVNLSESANMGLRDDKENDGQGGWTDQGPQQDGRVFENALRRRVFSGIPIYVQTEGKGILTMQNAHLRKAPASVEIPVESIRAKNLYIMHSAAWTSPTEKTVGTITLTDITGNSQSIPVTLGHDVGEWFYKVMPLRNGYTAISTTTPKGQSAGVYISKFPLNANLNNIAKITFNTSTHSMWLILGATLTGENWALPRSEVFTITENSTWFPLVSNPICSVTPGSALDRSNFKPVRKVSETGRVVINTQGHFAFANDPEKAIRFLACTITPRFNDQGEGIEDFKDHASIEQLVKECRTRGYNMIRTHFFDMALLKGMKQDGELNPKALDMFDYLVYYMRENGLYLNIDLMSSWIGYTAGNIYVKENNDPKKSFKYRIFFDDKIRENWREGVRKLLCRVNPYTGIRLIDDPVISMAVAYNEQEYGFWRKFDPQIVLPAWRSFLKKQYRSIEELKKVWGAKADKFNSFDDIPCFTMPSRLPDNEDVALFMRQTETDMAKWYTETMKQLGYPGPVTAYNCGKNMYYNMVRKDLPFIAMNSYHAHPSDWIMPGSSISQKSAIEQRMKIFRDYMGIRLSGKPLVVTEHNLVFWNQYRYEQAFVVGGYGALQGFDVLTTHGMPVRFNDDTKILSFANHIDPIAVASEYLTFFLFCRGDVSQLPTNVHVEVNEKDVFAKNGLLGALSTDLSLLSLIVGTDIMCMTQETKKENNSKDSVRFKLTETSSVYVSDAGFSQTIDNAKQAAEKWIKALKTEGILSESNTSNGTTIFESANHEIFADCPRNFMSINTPRLQGICAEAGTTASLKEFTVQKISDRGILAVVSLDGLEPIYKAKRMMLVFATNALNNDMKFTNENMTTLINIGKKPVLLQKGSFTVTVRNKNAKELKLYPLDFSGNRLMEIKPVNVDAEKATFAFKTTKEAATVFFEISTK